MRGFPWQLAAILLLVAIPACQKSSSSSSPAPLVVSAVVQSGAIASVANGVRADGANMVVIAVGGSPVAPIVVSTTRGTFAGGSRTVTLAVPEDTAVLTTCDARIDPTCAGTVTVTAKDSAGAFGSVRLRFVGYETKCNDGIDNNGDGRVDCNDPDCAGQTCSSGGKSGTCQSGACNTFTCDATAPEVCNNGVDDNCDGVIDCAASSCDGQPCSQTSSTAVCQNGACTEPPGYGLTVTAARARLPADGTATTAVTALATNRGAAMPGTTVTFTATLPRGSTSGGFVASPGATPTLTAAVPTGSDGKATVTFRATDGAGPVRIDASFSAQQQAVAVSTVVTMPALGSIELGGVQYPVMGVRTSGYQEQDHVTVKVLDTDEQPYPDGLAVTFAHVSFGGSYIATPLSYVTGCSATPCTVTGATASPAGTPDAEGLAAVDLHSGTAAGLAGVTASAAAGGVTVRFTVPSVPIVGAKASGSHLSLDCTPKNDPVLVWDHDCTFAYGGEPITCVARFADRFGNVLGRDTAATFMSEAGAPGAPVFTAETGTASTSIQVAGYPLPIDVAPVSGEPSVAGVAGCITGTRTANPRDGLVSIVVMARGEEGFVDLNGNGVWDAGEPFVDEGEPFVDQNDDGVWEPGEPYYDVNGNNSYDLANGRWDSDTVIWAETRVLFTGAPSNAAASPSTVTVTSSKTSGGTATSDVVDFTFTDVNLNELAPAKSSFDASSDGAAATASVTAAPATLDHLGMGFTQAYCPQAPGTAPASCSSLCQSAPCYRRTAISGYSPGSIGQVTITGGADPAAVPVSVFVSPTVDGIGYPRALTIPVTVK